MMNNETNTEKGQATIFGTREEVVNGMTITVVSLLVVKGGQRQRFEVAIAEGFGAVMPFEEDGVTRAQSAPHALCKVAVEAAQTYVLRGGNLD